MKDSLGSRIKRYEQVTRNCLTCKVPVIIRLDGRAFHTYTKRFQKPFSPALMDAMTYAASQVAYEMQGFKLAYIQSDEVTFLLTDFEDVVTEAWFDYNINKITSISASIMSVHFNKFMWEEKKVTRDEIAVFDARAFNVPLDDVENVFLWRVRDWERNSLQMYCQSMFSHKELHGKNTNAMHEMLYQKGKNWAKDLSYREKNGTFLSIKDGQIVPCIVDITSGKITYDIIQIEINDAIERAKRKHQNIVDKEVKNESKITMNNKEKELRKLIKEKSDIDLSYISSNRKLSEEFIREFKDKVDWDYISRNQKLSEKFIREFKDKVNWDTISRYQKLSEKFIREFKDKVNWYDISIFHKLSEKFIREFKDKVNWHYISRCQKLSEKFIREFKDKVYWYYISIYQKLSEKFIREFKDKVSWNSVSVNQKLSEKFIREFKDKVDWNCVSVNQKLSEKFIREFKDKVYWYYISKYQKLSEKFIREFKNKVGWYYISKYQKLSEKFIREFKNKVGWLNISSYQKLSEKFIKEFNLTIAEDCWIYKTKEEKLKYIKDNKLNKTYKLVDNKYIIAYKSTRVNGYSVCNFQYKYEAGKTYESSCDCNTDNYNSFGLSAWTKEKAIEYYDKGCLFKVRINIEDIGCFVQNNGKIRAKKITILEKCK